LIGRWFESDEEAWCCFLARETPLEDFWSVLPEPDGSILAGWLIEPPPHVKDAVRDLLTRFGALDRVAAVPRHFLHIWIHGVAHDPIGDRVSELVDAPARCGPSNDLARLHSGTRIASPMPHRLSDG
jgi:hypothetical protein